MAGVGRPQQAARAALEEARHRIKAALGWRHHLIFTSGATECAAIALGRQSRPRPALVSAVEPVAENSATLLRSFTTVAMASTLGWRR